MGARDPLVRAGLYRRHRLGWIYARSLFKNERLWAGAGADQLGSSTISSLGSRSANRRRRTGYLLFYILAFFVQHPAEIFKL